MPVSFTELTGSPTVRIANGTFVGSRRFMIPWSNSIDFAVELLGGYRNIGGTFNFTGPSSFPGVPQAICRDAQFDPFPDDKIDTNAGATLASNTNQPPYAIVTAQYTIEQNNNGQQKRSDQPSVPNGTYLTYNGNLGAEYMTIPGRTFVWYLTGEPVAPDVNPGILIPTEDFTLSWERVPYQLVPWTAIRNARGRVNSSTFMGHVAETVLFLGAQTTYEHQFSGDVLMKLIYNFKVREVKSTAGSTLFGWNHFYCETADSGEHWLKVADEDANFPYATADLTTLFSFA